MPPEHLRGVELAKPKLVRFGRFRGGPTLDGGFYLEIVGGEEVRRAEMTPRETVMVAAAMFRSQGVAVELDLSQFRHRHG